ncbi:hypothetical protein F5148DRAFT_1368231 [Russula earlei]|uniref:Uncharacterized protein n=1 Tax=Russula earlei TaxID=71964 RepID=A0ACC0U7U8_9AGAM|nr:hypothetical protein F5148DRAFT_1368231 [Russula earlei]
MFEDANMVHNSQSSLHTESGGAVADASRTSTRHENPDPDSYGAAAGRGGVFATEFEGKGIPYAIKPPGTGVILEYVHTVLQITSGDSGLPIKSIDYRSRGWQTDRRNATESICPLLFKFRPGHGYDVGDNDNFTGWIKFATFNEGEWHSPEWVGLSVVEVIGIPSGCDENLFLAVQAFRDDRRQRSWGDNALWSQSWMAPARPARGANNGRLHRRRTVGQQLGTVLH